MLAQAWFAPPVMASPTRTTTPAVTSGPTIQTSSPTAVESGQGSIVRSSTAASTVARDAVESCLNNFTSDTSETLIFAGTQRVHVRVETSRSRPTSSDRRSTTNPGPSPVISSDQQPTIRTPKSGLQAPGRASCNGQAVQPPEMIFALGNVDLINSAGIPQQIRCRP